MAFRLKVDFQNLKSVLSSVNLKAPLSFVSLQITDILLDADSKNLFFTEGRQGAITINIAESAAISFSRPAADSFGVTDAPALAVSRPVSDALSIAENLTRVVSYERTFTDAPTISESAALAFSSAQTDTTTILETEAKDVGKAVNDTQVSDQTFTVTVVSTAGGNKYYIDGVQQATLSLTAGATYRFDQSHSSNSGHPLRLSTTSNGTHGGGSEHSADPDVTINGVAGQAGAYTEINLEGYTDSMASTFFYYCSVHSGMGGQINITTTGDISMSESLARQVAYQRAFTDAYTLDDTASASDELQTDINMQKGNVFSVVEVHALGLERPVTDAPSLSESLQAIIVSKALADTLTMSEASLVGSGAIISDAPSITEAIQSLSSSKSLTESATISESLSILFVSGASSVLNTAALNTSVLN